MRKSLAFLLAAVLFAGPVWARMEQEVKEINPEGAKRLEINAELGAGEFRIVPRDMEKVAIVDMRYNPRRSDNKVDYEVTRSTGYLTLTSDHRSGSDFDTEDNTWEVTLSTRYESTLDFEIGACDADIDLGGVPVEELTLEIGAASGKVEFSKPNPIRMRGFNIEAGASSLDLKSIGNANFDRLHFEGGVGSFNINLEGEYQGECEVDIEIGLGSADIYLPANVPVRIETSGGNWLSSVDIHNDDLEEVDDDAYETDDYASADTRLIIYLEVGLGSIDIHRR